MLISLGVAIEGTQRPLRGMVNQACFNGVAVNVAQTGQGVPVILDNGGAEAVAPEMAEGVISMVVVLGIKSFKFTHYLGNIGAVLDVDDQVKMIGHAGKAISNHIIFQQYPIQNPAQHFSIMLGL